MMNYLHYEQEALKERYEKLVGLVKEILEALRQEEMKNLIAKKKQSKCRYWNRGFCKERESCQFFHPSEVCLEYCENGSCSEGRNCQRRHPQSCKHWARGKCWRGTSCLYLHRNEDFDRESPHEKSDDKIADQTAELDEEQDVDQIEKSDECPNVDQTEELDEEQEEHCSSGLTTDEILAMYENVELNLDDNDIISVEDILKIYDTNETVDESFPMKKTSRIIGKKKNSKRHEGNKQTNHGQ